MKFKLTESDKEYLLKIGYHQSDFRQIERAANITQFEKITSDKAEKINMETALTLLGREDFLSGISRSAFHWSAMRECQNGYSIYFDSSKLFK